MLTLNSTINKFKGQLKLNLHVTKLNIIIKL